MSDESYRLITIKEANAYKDYAWFTLDAIKVGDQWLVPEKYLLKDLDKKSYYRTKLQELLNSFDFEKVNIIMDALDWTWAGVCGTPGKEDMIPVIKQLYKDIEDFVLDDILQ